jgi:hypothetical protein
VTNCVPCDVLPEAKVTVDDLKIATPTKFCVRNEQKQKKIVTDLNTIINDYVL